MLLYHNRQVELLFVFERVAADTNCAPKRLVLQQFLADYFLAMKLKLLDIPVCGHESSAQEVCIRACEVYR
jgi:hypothetical protein